MDALALHLASLLFTHSLLLLRTSTSIHRYLVHPFLLNVSFQFYCPASSNLHTLCAFFSTSLQTITTCARQFCHSHTHTNASNVTFRSSWVISICHMNLDYFGHYSMLDSTLERIFLNQRPYGRIKKLWK